MNKHIKISYFFNLFLQIFVLIFLLRNEKKIKSKSFYIKKKIKKMWVVDFSEKNVG